MKTKNLILNIALVALTATSFGQRSSIRERLFNKSNNQVEFITADFNSDESSRIENWMHDLRDWAINKDSRDTYSAPVVARTIFVEQIDVVYEEQLGIESWMSTPFEPAVAEEALGIESWMTAPFENDLAEEELELEFWMIAPFESNLTEQDLYLESWMTVPFESSEDIEIEDWMASAWI